MTDPNDTTTAAPRPHLSGEAKATIRARIREFDKDRVSLGQLRRLRHMTQAQVATAMGTEQDRVSRLEQRADVRVSTLREYVAALGGTLKLVAELPDQEPLTVELPARDTTRRPRQRLKPTRD